MNYMDANTTAGEKAWQKLYKNATSNIEKSWRAHPIKQQLYDHSPRKLSELDEPDMRDTAGEVGTSSYVMYFYGTLHMAEQK